jgi:hypothetical protein
MLVAPSLTWMAQQLLTPRTLNPQKPVLLVIDNVSDIDAGQQLEALLPLEVPEGSRIIITSRKPAPETADSPWRTVRMGRGPGPAAAAAACCALAARRLSSRPTYWNS